MGNDTALDSVKSQLQKLEIDRAFYNVKTGGFTAAKIIYTTEHTCLHKEFDYTNKNAYQCRQCPGMIFLNQINN